MASERYAKFLKDFGPRVTELLDQLQKACLRRCISLKFSALDDHC
jgi:hypothetical protein